MVQTNNARHKQLLCNKLRRASTLLSGENRIRTTAENAGKLTVQGKSGAKYGALLAEMTSMYRELQAVVDAWPTLTDSTKAGIMEKIRSAGSKGTTKPA